jgi:mannosyltransferase OCH1-like enzyme
MIPKKIFQTWYTKNIPSEVKNSIESMLAKNREYEYFLFDDLEMENYIKINFSERIFNAFDSLNIGAAKADLWRYLVLYREGGIYLDMDSEIKDDLNDLIKSKDSAIITRERNLGKFVQWCLMFSPGHPILDICISRCVENIESKITEDILKLTGPDVFSESVYEYCKSLEFDFFLVNDDIINEFFIKNNLDLRLFGFDYEQFCKFKGEHSHFLYRNKLDWRAESLEKSVFKNKN